MNHSWNTVVRSIRLAAGLMCWAWACTAQASPPAVEDAGVVAAGECFVEASASRATGARTLSVAPACGLGAGLELTIERAVQSGNDSRGQTGMVLKWSPEVLRTTLGGSEISWGAWVATARSRPAGGQAQAAESTLALITSAQLRPELSAHLHLGVARPDAASPWSRLTHAALYWSPTTTLQWFAEVQSFANRDLMGASVWATGARVWVIPDRVGVYVRTQKASDRPSGWSLGLGWYPPAF